MKLWAEIPAFGALAAGIHVAVLAGWPLGGTPDGAGSDGVAHLTISGASGAVEAVVAAWDRPPEALDHLTGRIFAASPAGGSRVTPSVSRDLRPWPATETAKVVAPPSDLLPAIEHPPVPGLPRPEAGAVSPLRPNVPETAISADLETASRGAPSPRRADLRPLPQFTHEAAPNIPPAPAGIVRPMARPDLIASGAGGGKVRGTTSTAPAASMSEKVRLALIASWGAEIRARIEARKVRPKNIRDAGRPVVRITVARNGVLESVRVIRTSRIDALDAAAVEAVRRAGKFPPAPGKLDLPRASFDLPIAFTR